MEAQAISTEFLDSMREGLADNGFLQLDAVDCGQSVCKKLHEYVPPLEFFSSALPCMEKKLDADTAHKVFEYLLPKYLPGSYDPDDGEWVDPECSDAVEIVKEREAYVLGECAKYTQECLQDEGEGLDFWGDKSNEMRKAYQDLRDLVTLLDRRTAEFYQAYHLSEDEFNSWRASTQTAEDEYMRRTFETDHLQAHFANSVATHDYYGFKFPPRLMDSSSSESGSDES